MRNQIDEYIRRGYATGYQDALQEIIEIAESAGFDKAIEYARANRVTLRYPVSKVL